MPLSFADHDESISFILEQLNTNLRVKLNDWEKSFVASVQKQHEKGKTLSKKQKQSLSDIWEKY